MMLVGILALPYVGDSYIWGKSTVMKMYVVSSQQWRLQLVPI